MFGTKVGLRDKASAYQHSYLVDRGREVAIAELQLMLCDEATSALDQRRQARSRPYCDQ